MSSNSEIDNSPKITRRDFLRILAGAAGVSGSAGLIGGAVQETLTKDPQGFFVKEQNRAMLSILTSAGLGISTYVDTKRKLSRREALGALVKTGASTVFFLSGAGTLLGRLHKNQPGSPEAAIFKLESAPEVDVQLSTEILKRETTYRKDYLMEPSVPAHIEDCVDFFVRYSGIPNLDKDKLTSSIKLDSNHRYGLNFTTAYDNSDNESFYINPKDTSFSLAETPRELPYYSPLSVLRQAVWSMLFETLDQAKEQKKWPDQDVNVKNNQGEEFTLEYSYGLSRIYLNKQTDNRVIDLNLHKALAYFRAQLLENKLSGVVSSYQPFFGPESGRRALAVGGLHKLYLADSGIIGEFIKAHQTSDILQLDQYLAGRAGVQDQQIAFGERVISSLMIKGSPFFDEYLNVIQGKPKQPSKI